MNGDAWRYAPHLSTPAAQQALVQAALSALISIQHLRRFGVEPGEAVVVELREALRLAGHPAGFDE